MLNVFLHGFWGAPSDWNPVLQRLSLTSSVWVPDLYLDESIGPGKNLDEWLNRFSHQLIHRSGRDQRVNLIGYSMGGRLAMALTQAWPEKFASVLLLSTRPTPLSEEENEARVIWENHWCERFETESWDFLESAWQLQDVFAADRPVEHRHLEPLRGLLPRCLKGRSVRDFQPFEPPAKLKVGWLFGASDQKYKIWANRLLSRGDQGQIGVIDGAGHRLIEPAASVIVQWVEGRDYGNGIFGT